MRRRRVRSRLRTGLGCGAAAILVALAIVFWLGARTWLAGPSGIHDAAFLPSKISVCDREYRLGGQVRTREALEAEQSPPLLLDPGLFGFTGCPGADAQGQRPCSDSATDGPCATVVYVRIGDDAFMAYGLVGGP